MNINIWLPLLCIVALAMFNVPIWLALLGGALPYFLILQPTLPVQIAVQRVVPLPKLRLTWRSRSSSRRVPL